MRRYCVASPSAGEETASRDWPRAADVLLNALPKIQDDSAAVLHEDAPIQNPEFLGTLLMRYRVKLRQWLPPPDDPCQPLRIEGAQERIGQITEGHLAP